MFEGHGELKRRNGKWSKGVRRWRNRDKWGNEGARWEADYVWSCPVDASTLGWGWLSGGEKGGTREKAACKQTKVKGLHPKAILKRGHKDTRKKEWQFEAVNAHMSDDPIFLVSGSVLYVRLFLKFLQFAFKGLFTVVTFDRYLRNKHLLY